MAGGNEEHTTRTRVRPFYRDHRFRLAMRGILLLVCALAFVHEIFGGPDSQYFKNTETKSYDLAVKGFGPLAPSAFIRAFEERQMRCDYRWLVLCQERNFARLPESNLNFAKCLVSRHGDPVYDCTSALDGFRDGFYKAVEFPDAAAHLLRQNFTRGWLAATTTSVFIALVLLISYAGTKGIPFLLPISFPLATMFASGLFWLLERAAALTVFAILALLLLLALLPELIARCFDIVLKGTDLQHLWREARETWHQALQFAKGMFKTRV